MAPPIKLKAYSTAPDDDSLTPSTRQFLNWVWATLNALVGQQTAAGAGVAALSPGVINPSTAQLSSIGSRPQSWATSISYNVPSPTEIDFYWDGTTNGGVVSAALQVYRDDGTITPAIYGNKKVTGLSPSTTYYLYPYYDEVTGKVMWATNGKAVGTPPIAFSAKNILALQQQGMRSHVPLGATFSTSGIATPAAGGGGSGGGGGGGGGGKGNLF